MKKRIILFEDDDEQIRDALERTLLNKPYRILCASSVAEAKKIINKKSVHLIISYLLMPEIDGITLLKWVKTVKQEIFRMVLAMKAAPGNIIDVVNKGNIYHCMPKPWYNTANSYNLPAF